MKLLERIISFITCIFLALMVLLALWQVISRYALKNPSQFTDELLRFMLIWTGMLGAVYAFIDEKHLSLIFLRNKLNKKWQDIAVIFSDIMTLLFSVLILLWGGYKTFVFYHKSVVSNNETFYGCCLFYNTHFWFFNYFNNNF